ncbi:unnamed protein product [Psylliodes chrysocephalus]|uniref:Uncharacterized protein n=1 Tax=Psylliodes chrysocephalus TaxID=3402493 RepID=A0A9P0G7K9_9CUCU|nr:unnamed protein product [Psylliodes chrysocephala]
MRLNLKIALKLRKEIEEAVKVLMVDCGEQNDELLLLKDQVNDIKEVHVIFDKYKKPSIKDFEHDLRGKEDSQYDVLRRDNNRPADFRKLLRSTNFKEKFVEFQIEDWTRDEFIILMEEKSIKPNYDQCYTYEIHCTDSDIPIIMLANVEYLKNQIQMIIDLSTSKKKLCRVYSLKTKNDIDKGKNELFAKGYKSRNDNEEVLKKSDVTNEQSKEEGDEDDTDAVDEDDEDFSDEPDED